MMTEAPTKKPKRSRIHAELSPKLRAKLAKLAKREKAKPAQTLRNLIASAK